jgi:hypothetical protein
VLWENSEKGEEDVFSTYNSVLNVLEPSPSVQEFSFATSAFGSWTLLSEVGRVKTDDSPTVQEQVHPL